MRARFLLQNPHISLVLGAGSNTHESELSEESDVEDYEHADADSRYLISRCLIYH